VISFLRKGKQTNQKESSMKKNKSQTLLGAHVSGAGGLQNALLIGEELGCNTIQIFTRNNRQWAFDSLTPEEIAPFVEQQKESPIKTVVSHASYLINLGSPNKIVAARSKKALTAELVRCQQLSIPYLVLHPGAHLESPESLCIEQIADSLTKIIEQTPGPCVILLENMAGQGSSIGSSFEQLAQIRSLAIPKERIGICFDTCHAFAAGYNFTNSDSYKALWKEFDAIIGLELLKAMHLNDSQKELGSHVDRHANIGKGKIGLEAFHLIMNDSRFENIPKIIETPLTSLEDHRRNLEILRKLID